MAPIFCLFFFLMIACFGEDIDVVPDSATVVPSDFGRTCKFGDYTFVLETATLADVVRVLRSGTIRFNGKDAARGEYFVEYRNGPYLIRFASNAEMGGRDHQLEEVEIRPLASDEIGKTFPPVHSSIVFQFGQAGMSWDDLNARLGEAKKTDDSVWYEFNGKVSLQDGAGKSIDCDVSSFLKVRVVSSKVIAMDLCRVTSS